MPHLSAYHKELSVRERVRVAAALLLAAVAGLLGWLGLTRRSEWHGIDSLGAVELMQIAVPIALALLMIAAAWLVRGVVLARLQVAVLLSLIVHLLLLLLLQLMPLPAVVVHAADPAELEGAQEILDMPDYGGMENTEATPERWQMDIAVDTPERQLEEQLRQSTEPERPHERETEENLPDTRIDPAQMPPVQKETMAQQMTESLQQLMRQSFQEPTAPDSPAQAPELTDARVAETAPRDVAADLTRQPVDVSVPNQLMNREQLPDIDHRMAVDQQAVRAELNPTLPDRAEIAATRRAQTPTAADSPIEAARLDAEPSARDFAPTESTSALERRRAELARATGSATPSTRLGEARASAANVSAARSERAPEVSGGGNSAPLSRSTTGAGVQGADGPIDAPQVSGGSAAAQGLSFEPSRSDMSRSAAGGVAGPHDSSSPLNSLSALPGGGTGNTAAIGRAAARESIGSPSGSGAISSPLARGNTRGGLTGATGAAESVKVSEAPNGAGRSGMAAAPSATHVGRSAAGRVAASSPSGTGSGTGPGLAPTRLGAGSGAAISAVNTQGRGSEPAPRLGQDSAGGGRSGAGLPGRAAPSSGGPQGVSGGIESEAMALTPGPQPGGRLTSSPQPGGALPSGGLSRGSSAGAAGVPGTGARTSVSRRSAALPGSSASGDGKSPGAALASTARPSIGAPARRNQADAPEMHALVSQLARQVPGGGLGKSGLADVSPAFSLRSGAMRKEAARTLGGTPQTERAVEMGIAWLAQHQAPDGSWGIHDFDKQCKGHQCDGAGSFESPTAGTGLALLAFLGAGYTHQSGQYQDNVARGIKWLIANQKPSGDLLATETPFVRYYSHGIAAIALCEAYGMTQDTELREATQKALQFILDSQHPELGGWRYESRSESDTSVSGWQLMALKSGEMAGFSVPPNAYQQMTRWLDSVERGSAGGLYAYHPTRRESLAMTAEGLLMRQYLGFSRNNPRLRAGADYLDLHLPDLSDRDTYYWYYATQMMYHMQGTHWDHWNSRLRDMLTEIQSKDGGEYGSWSPTEPTPDRWGDAGGRLYVTCMHLLILEVYYRHLPLYQQLER